MLKRIILYFIMMGFVSTAYAAGDCSPYLGLATINEFFKDKTSQANDVDDFVELKRLDSSIPFAVFSQWSIQVCEANEAGNNNDSDGCSTKINLSSFTDTTVGLVLTGGSDSFSVGATLTLNGLQSKGNYSTANPGGTPYTVTVNYN